MKEDLAAASSCPDVWWNSCLIIMIVVFWALLLKLCEYCVQFSSATVAVSTPLSVFWYNLGMEVHYSNLQTRSFPFFQAATANESELLKHCNDFLWETNDDK